jgi:ParB family transcriptional regulator, chromosome partitioning protein
MERRLGKGLGSLLGANTEAGEGTDGFTIPTELLKPNPFQPRRAFDPVALQELASSLRQHGMMQPIVVRKQGDRYEIISGERRWRASQQIGLARVPAVLRRDVSDRDMLELALVENLQRRDLNPIERATGFRAMRDQLGLTQELVAERVGLQRSTVANHLRLLELPVKVQEALVADLIQMGHARALLGLSDPHKQLQLLETTVRESLSVREVEARTRQQSVVASSSLKIPAKQDTSPSWTAALSRRLTDALGCKVRVAALSGERAQVTIECFSHAELDRIVEIVAPAEKL